MLFFEDFTNDDMADFEATFDWSVADIAFGRIYAPWLGHHNMACDGPNTERTLVHGPAWDNENPGVEFWLCGPGGPGTDHMMTSNGSNDVFGVTAFSPKREFSGDRVCWDVNLTESFGRRLWWELQLIPAATVANARSMLQMGTINGSSSERGTAYITFGHGMGGTLAARTWPADAVVFDFTEEMVKIWEGQRMAFDPGRSWEPGVRYVTQDRATRAHHCMVDNGDDTITFSQQRGNSTYTRTVQGVSFPKPYRVIYSAHNYNAGKDGTASNATWHWDNLLVERGQS